MLTELPYLFLSLLIIVNILAVSGIVILNSYKKYFKNRFLFFFAALTISISLIVVVTSLSITNFKSVNLILVLIILYAAYLFRKDKNNYVNGEQTDTINRKSILFLFVELNLFCSLMFCIYYILYSYHKSIFIGLPQLTDIHFYSRLSRNFINYHSETRTFYLAPSKFVSPYHYFEIWVNTFVSIFRKTSLLNSIFISIPLFNCILYFGLKAILSEVFHKKALIIRTYF